VTVVLEKENWEENDEQDEGKHERQDQKEKHQIYRLEVHGFIVLLPLAPHSAKCICYSLTYIFGQILAGNARKVSAVRFERVNDMDEVSEARDVKNMVPKFVRKWSSEEDSDGNLQAKNAVFDEHLIAETESMKKE